MKVKVGDMVEPTKESIAKSEEWIYIYDGKWPAKVTKVFDNGDTFLLEGKKGGWGTNGLQIAKLKKISMENK